MNVGVSEPATVAGAEVAGLGLEERLRAVEAAGSGIEERLRAVEAGLVRLETRFDTEMKHFVTKADLEAVKTMMERHFNRLLRWGLGIMITATGALSALIFGILRTTGN